MLEAIARVNAELGTTTVVITHNVVIGRMADRVLHLMDGRIERVERNSAKVRAVGAHLVSMLQRKAAPRPSGA